MKNKIRQHVLKLMENDSSNPSDLYKKLFVSDFWKNSDVVATTMSTDFELDTMPIIKRGLAEHKTIAIPKTFTNRKMKFYQFQAVNQLVRSRFGILEPAENQIPIEKKQIDLIVVPGVAFSSSNHQRIGYGGGFYDCYLQDYVGITVSLVRKIQLVDFNWPIEETDIAVQHLLIEEG
ncbi:5-formyltetrahydrofolate cyclo-ligase [Fructilactobacillus frigidiflavus]|uniref:5-formyltetrahydrofolate cyclo-ligase n=1 Tax=Fructilactobacillus frigidiflavus TaxID=3242688 RepID=UPI00375765A8